MDARYFLKNRTDFIRFYYETAEKPFVDRQFAIEQQLPPFDDPHYSEDTEPPYLDEWVDADSARQILGLSCVSLLSDSLKLYFHALQQRVIGFSFAEKNPFKEGFVPAFLGVLASILDTDWSDCPADLAVIEQIVLARNRGQHGSHLSSLNVDHDGKTLEKHPRPFFASEEEIRMWTREDGTISSFLRPSIKLTREKLFVALEEVDKFSDYIESRLGKAWKWGQRG